ncbi:hypothetical protein C8J57DRAFT_1412449 [Mycena rebaudengoi]|nr:hypothetical protein C8J57DRAFT_1412449 [Mycena rebaudengoi]
MLFKSFSGPSTSFNVLDFLLLLRMVVPPALALNNNKTVFYCRIFRLTKPLSSKLHDSSLVPGRGQTYQWRFL